MRPLVVSRPPPRHRQPTAEKAGHCIHGLFLLLLAPLYSQHVYSQHVDQPPPVRLRRRRTGCYEPHALRRFGPAPRWGRLPPPPARPGRRSRRRLWRGGRGGGLRQAVRSVPPLPSGRMRAKAGGDPVRHAQSLPQGPLQAGARRRSLPRRDLPGWRLRAGLPPRLRRQGVRPGRLRRLLRDVRRRPLRRGRLRLSSARRAVQPRRCQPVLHRDLRHARIHLCLPRRPGRGERGLPRSQPRGTPGQRPLQSGQSGPVRVRHLRLQRRRPLHLPPLALRGAGGALRRAGGQCPVL